MLLKDVPMCKETGHWTYTRADGYRVVIFTPVFELHGPSKTARYDIYLDRAHEPMGWQVARRYLDLDALEAQCVLNECMKEGFDGTEGPDHSGDQGGPGLTSGGKVSVPGVTSKYRDWLHERQDRMAQGLAAARTPSAGERSADEHLTSSNLRQYWARHRDPGTLAKAVQGKPKNGP